MRPLQTVLVISVMLLCSTLLRAHESDHYTMPPGRQFADMGRYVNQMFYDVLARGVERLNSTRPTRPQSPDEVADAVNGLFPIALFGIEEMDRKLRSEEMLRCYPGKLVGYYPNPSLRRYAETPLYPLRAWQCNTFKVYGVYTGTDKIGHFSDMGMIYYRRYREAIHKGRSEEAARKYAIEIGTDGLISEKSILGWATAGAYSNADLASNYCGMLFYINLTQPVRLKGSMLGPLLVWKQGRWQMANHVSADSDFMRWFISEHFDESLNPSVYLSHMRGGIRKAIEEAKEGVLYHQCDANGNRRPRAYFDAKQKELSTYWGEDYGHLAGEGRDNDLLTISKVCFPPPPDPSRPRSCDAQGLTPLHHAADTGDVQLILQLLSAGADVNAPIRSNERWSSDWGCTPLHYAARSGRTEAVRALLAHGAHVNAADDRGTTPLHRAVAQAAAAEALLEGGAKVNAVDAFGRTALHWAVRDPESRITTLLLQRGANVNIADKQGMPPLHLAAEAGNANALSTLLEAGADMNQTDTTGQTALHIAARQWPGLAIMLVERGAPVNARDAFGRTPLHEAAASGSDSVVSSLLQHRARDSADAYGLTAHKLASRPGRQTPVMQLLNDVAQAKRK